MAQIDDFCCCGGFFLVFFYRLKHNPREYCLFLWIPRLVANREWNDAKCLNVRIINIPGMVNRAWIAWATGRPRLFTYANVPVHRVSDPGVKTHGKPYILYQGPSFKFACCFLIEIFPGQLSIVTDYRSVYFKSLRSVRTVRNREKMQRPIL